MKDIRFDGRLEYPIDQIGFINLSREENYLFEYKSGKILYSLIYAENGALEYVFSELGKSLILEKGMFLFVPKHLPYRTRYLKNGTKIKIIIFDIPGKEIPRELSAPILRKSLPAAELFDSIFGEKTKNTLFLSAKIYELLWILLSEKPALTKEHRKILPALREMEEKYFENRKIAYYAGLCHMSESNFRLLFREHTGFSPVEYRNLIRISEARKMIRSGEFTVSEAAYLAGFQNMSFFYELYHRSNKK